MDDYAERYITLEIVVLKGWEDATLARIDKMQGVLQVTTLAVDDES
jgi:hypothetical protein